MDLEQAKAELRAIISGVPAADEYTEESYGAVTEAVAASNALLADDAKPTVEDLNAAGNYAADEVAALKTAIEEAKAAETAEEITAKTETVKTATAALNKAVEDEKAAENAKPVVTAAAGDCEVVLTWTAPEGATRYAVYSYLNGKYYAQGTTTATTATVKNLTNGTKYGFLVRAYVNGTWTSFTSADVVYAAPAVSSKPVLTVTARDGEAVLVWTAPAGATKYNVYSYLNGKYYAQGTTTATTSTVKNLTNGTKYGFLVRAFVNGAWTTFTSDDIVYATPAEYPGSFCLCPMV